MSGNNYPFPLYKVFNIEIIKEYIKALRGVPFNLKTIKRDSERLLNYGR